MSYGERMDKEQELFAENLTKELFLDNEQSINKIDIFLYNPVLFERLVLEGVIKRDEAGFLAEHSNAFKKIYTSYLNDYNRKLVSKCYIIQKVESKRILNSTLLDIQTKEQIVDSNSQIKSIEYRVDVNRVFCFVISKQKKTCPACHRKTVYDPIQIKTKKGKLQLNACKCSGCGHYTISYPEYKRNACYVLCMNPGILSQIESQHEHKIEKKRRPDYNPKQLHNGLPKEREQEKHKVMLPSLIKTTAGGVYTYCEFKLYSLKSKREIAVFIQDTEKSHREINQWLLTNRSTIGIECLKAIANGVDNIRLGDIDYIIRDVKISDAKYIKRYKEDAYYLKHANINNKNPRLVDFGSESVDVYVYFKLSNSCLHLQHSVESVTMRSINRQTGKRYQVNAYYCSKCRKYFINHEAVKGLIDRNMYPAFHYVIADHYDGELKPMSQLMLYGYSARANGPSAVTRHNILKWVIDSGLMSKPEIIKDLQFKIAYNGKKPGNEAARDKWEDDLDFLNYYVADNTRVIKGRLRR